MSDWDEDSEQLRANLHFVLAGIRRDAIDRARPSIESARVWHSGMMRELALPRVEYSGGFRGTRGLEGHEVSIGGHYGVRSDQVPAELDSFESRLQELVSALDALIPPGKDLNADELAAVINVCAWIHSEWIRIHPFVNGNGRTARLWAVSIAMRYSLPVFVRTLPRPEGRYDSAAAASMEGDWRPTAKLFRRMYAEAIRQVT